MRQHIILAVAMALPSAAAALPTTFASATGTSGLYRDNDAGDGIPIGFPTLTGGGEITAAPPETGYVGGQLQVQFGPSIFDVSMADDASIGRISLVGADRASLPYSYIVISPFEPLSPFGFDVVPSAPGYLEIPFVFNGSLGFLDSPPGRALFDFDQLDDGGTPSDFSDDSAPLTGPFSFLPDQNLEEYFAGEGQDGVVRIFYDGDVPKKTAPADFGGFMYFDGPLDVTRIEVAFVGAPEAVAPIPLPAGLPMMLAGLGAVALLRRRR